jgi:hypothetical protein
VTEASQTASSGEERYISLNMNLSKIHVPTALKELNSHKQVIELGRRKAPIKGLEME